MTTTETRPCTHPGCPEDMQYIPAHRAEPDTNTAACRGGWSCPGGHFDENPEPDDEPDLDDQPRRTLGATVEILSKWGGR